MGSIQDNQQQNHDGEMLRILIIGAGIGGLSAALSLRRQGHQVLVTTNP